MFIHSSSLRSLVLASLSSGLVACVAADDPVDEVNAAAAPALRSGGGTVFVPGALIGADHTVTLPLREGRSGGRPVWYIITEGASSNAAAAWRTGRADKLARARNTGAVQRVTLDAAGRIVFPATVDFSPERVVAPDPVRGFPPRAASPGAVGAAGYSPLVQLPDGTILNAPQLANDSGKADKVVSLDLAAKTVRFELTDGFSNGQAVLYISTDSSSPVAAALEGVTYAPALDAAPFAGGDGTDSARSTLAAFVNGATGVGNPNRQGLNSTLLGQGDPLNILAWTPNQGRYSPLWDAHLSAWTPGHAPVRLTDIDDVIKGAEAGEVSAPDGSAWGPSNFIVNCPIIATR
jgi:hypothetical protein